MSSKFKDTEAFLKPAELNYLIETAMSFTNAQIERITAITIVLHYCHTAA